MKTETTESKQITVEDLQAVLYKMDFYKRTAGYIAHDLKGNLTFFDSNP
jgi:hypothetical protein